MTAPILRTTVDLAETARRDTQHRLDLERVIEFQTMPPPWADPEAFRAAVAAVTKAYPGDWSVFRVEKIENALWRHVIGAHPLPLDVDQSARAVAVRAYGAVVARRRMLRTLNGIAIAVPSLLLGAAIMAGLWQLFCGP